MKKYLVIGNPIEHSLSPKLYNCWLKKNNIKAIFEKKLANKGDLKKLIEDVKDGGIQGFNVTAPFKKYFIEKLDWVEERALDAQAVNTVYRKFDKKLNKHVVAGDNTDIYGFVKSLKPYENKFKSAHTTALVLGAGGVTSAVVKGLCLLGIKNILISNRTKAKSEKIKNQYHKVKHILDWGKDDDVMQKSDIIINTTSLGLKKDDKIPLNYKKYKKSLLGRKKIFYDLIYNPKETNFLKQGKELGHDVMNGKMMFIYQAQLSFKIWHGILPKIDNEIINLLND